MALNASGPISLGGATAGQSINLELGLSATAQIGMNDAAVRGLAGVPSGAISLSNFYSKSSLSADYGFTYVIPGSYTWVAPSDVNKVSVVAIGGGGAGGSMRYVFQCCSPLRKSGAGGSGGALAYINNLSITPGGSYAVVVGQGGCGSCGAHGAVAGGDSSFANSTTLVAGGGPGANKNTAPGVATGVGTVYAGGAGGCTAGSPTSGGGGGAGGYGATGGKGGLICGSSNGASSTGGGGGGGRPGCGSGYRGGAGGGGVSVYGRGANGAGGTAVNQGGGGGSCGEDGANPAVQANSVAYAFSGHGGMFGGGGGGAPTCGTSYNTCGVPLGSSGRGAAGAVRIISPGNSKTFPSTNVSYSSAEGASALYLIAGSYTWVAPAGVTSVSVVAVGAGGGHNPQWPCDGYRSGGGGGGLGYKNNIAVTAANSYTVVVGHLNRANNGGNSYFVNTSLVMGIGGKANTSGTCHTGGSYVGDGGGQGGSTLNGRTGGGAGGYSGTGGAGVSTYQNGNAGAGGAGGSGGFGRRGPSENSYGGGGGVGLWGAGPNGAGGTGSGCYPGGTSGGGGSYGRGGYPATGICMLHGGDFGGGAGSGKESSSYRGGSGGRGAVRIVWPGTTRQFPSTNVNRL